MNRCAPLQLVVLLGLAGSYAWSADVRDVLHNCVAIDGDRERLACYDKLAGRASPPSRVTAVPSPSAPAPSASAPAPSASAPAPSADKPLSKETFGLYSS